MEDGTFAIDSISGQRSYATDFMEGPSYSVGFDTSESFRITSGAKLQQARLTTPKNLRAILIDN
jgi:hypothetical protein